MEATYCIHTPNHHPWTFDIACDHKPVSGRVLGKFQSVFIDNCLSLCIFLLQIHVRRAFPAQSPSLRPWCLQVAWMRGSVWWFPVIPQVSKSDSRRCTSTALCVSSCWVDYTFHDPQQLRGTTGAAGCYPWVSLPGLALSWQGYCGGVSFWERHGPLIPVISTVPMVTGAVFPKQTTVGCLSVAAHT